MRDGRVGLTSASVFMKTKILLGLMFALIAAISAGAAAADGFSRENDVWRAKRIAELTAPDGWLSLVGLHFLKPGENTVGHAPASDVVLGRGPARLGVATLAADGKVTLPADEVAAAAGTIAYELFCALAARVPVKARQRNPGGERIGAKSSQRVGADSETGAYLGVGSVAGWRGPVSHRAPPSPDSTPGSAPEAQACR